jgi:hypothetical protein
MPRYRILVVRYDDHRPILLYHSDTWPDTEAIRIWAGTRQCYCRISRVDQGHDAEATE